MAVGSFSSSNDDDADGDVLTIRVIMAGMRMSPYVSKTAFTRALYTCGVEWVGRDAAP